MAHARYVAPLIGLVLLSMSGLFAHTPRSYAALTNASFQRTWERQDLPVALGRAERSWTWGPRALTVAVSEAFVDAPSTEKMRTVQYFDKGRMELDNRTGSVTRGLLPVEMILGAVQIGFSTFQEHAGANIAVVGDPGEFFPTYADLRAFYQSPGTGAPEAFGKPVTALLRPDGSVSSFERYAADPGTFLREGLNGHGVPQAFIDLQNQAGLVYEDNRFVTSRLFDPALEIFGLPVTEPYWVTTLLNGRPTTILFQVFERRVLTYNPTNEPRWRVEMGNVGRHYLEWRYGADRPPQPSENEQPAIPANAELPPRAAPATAPVIVPPSITPSSAAISVSPTSTPTSTPTATSEDGGGNEPPAPTSEPPTSDSLCLRPGDRIDCYVDTVVAKLTEIASPGTLGAVHSVLTMTTMLTSTATLLTPTAVGSE